MAKRAAGVVKPNEGLLARAPVREPTVLSCLALTSRRYERSLRALSKYASWSPVSEKNSPTPWRDRLGQPQEETHDARSAWPCWYPVYLFRHFPNNAKPPLYRQDLL